MNDHARNYDNETYLKYALPGRLDKEIHYLEGIIKGITIDNKLSRAEIDMLKAWCRDHELVRNRAPYNELVDFIEKTLEDGFLSDEEQKDLIWLCQRFTTPNKYYDKITADLQRLQGIMAGIAADGKIKKTELLALSKWISDREHLKTNWPYDEIDSIITTVLADGIIDEKEHKTLLAFCREFTAKVPSLLIEDKIDDDCIRYGACAMCPEIIFKDRLFCFTGKSSRHTRASLVETLEKLGGRFSPTVRTDLNYLVVCDEGNRCWAFSCYGRKVEEAVNFRKRGLPIQIVHELDFWDSVQETRGRA